MHGLTNRMTAAVQWCAGAMIGLSVLAWLPACAASSAEAAPAPTTVEGLAYAEFSTRFNELKLGVSRQDVEQQVGSPPQRRGPSQLVWEMWDDGKAHRRVFWAQFTGGRLVATGSSADDEPG